MNYPLPSPRNFVHSGLLQIPSLTVSPVQLFNYLLDHEKTYGMAVIRMEPVIIDPNTQVKLIILLCPS